MHILLGMLRRATRTMGGAAPLSLPGASLSEEWFSAWVLSTYWPCVAWYGTPSGGPHVTVTSEVGDGGKHLLLKLASHWAGPGLPLHSLVGRE